MTRVAGRIPRAASASITARWPVMVVVRRAETPTMSAPTSAALSAKRSGGTSTPRSWTSKPAAPSIVATRFVPISWMSPLTVPITTRPRTWRSVARAFISGSRTAKADFIARAASIMSGRNISPQLNCSPTKVRPGM